MNNTLQILLNRSLPFQGEKIRLLDQLTKALSSPNIQEVNDASSIWKVLSDDSNFWLSSDQILVHSTYNHTKFLTLVIMENGIKTRWLALPAEEREGIKAYIVNMVVTLGGNPNLPKDVESLLSKANSILVQIVKYEWNTTWKSFIPDICGASKGNLTLCQNNLNILKMLIEEIFDFSKNQMTAQQIASLKEHMHQQFTQVFELCDSILQNADKVSSALSKACLQTLYSFLSWIPIYFIFFSGIIERIIPFITSDLHREPALRCLVEIVSLNVNQAIQRVDEVKQKLFLLLKQSLEKFNQLIPINENIETIKAFKQRNESFSFEITCQNIARFLISFLQQQFEWVVQTCASTPVVETEVRKALKWLVRLLQLPYEQTYRMIVEFFHFLSKKVKERSNSGPKPLLYSREALKEMVEDIFEQVKKTVILRMMKPQEVLIVIDDTGYPVREQISNTQNNALYEMMRELLINFAGFNWSTTKTFILNKIEKQSHEEFSFDLLNSLSWAVGSMNGHIPEHQQKPFLIAVIRTLLHLCEAKKGKQNKAVVASCIMYVVGQYPNFLKSNWNFLKTVVKKLFEFMKERFPGVMDMACNTFLKISKSTSEQFVKLQENEGQPFVYDLIRRIPQEICDLASDSLKLTFYEAVGHLISSEKNPETKTVLMKSTLGHHLEEYYSIIKSAETNTEFLKQEEIQRKLMYFLRINEKLAYSVGLAYGSILVNLGPTLNNIYVFYSTEVEKVIQTQGKAVLNYLTVKRMRIICKQVLKVYNTYISKCENLNKQEVDSVLESFVMPLVGLLVDTYSKSLPEAKDAEFLTLMTSVFERLNTGISHEIVIRVLTAVFGTTLAMISTDFNSFPEIRMAFFSFLKSIIKYNFEQLYNMPEDKFHTIMDCIVWSIKHELNTFSDLGLDLLFETLQNLTNNPAISNIFYERYYTNLLKDILEVLTDGYHKSGFKMQCKILFLMFQVVLSNYLSSKIGGATQIESNQEYLYNYLVNTLSSAFTNVSKQDTMNKVRSMLSLSDEKLFKAQVGDYLVMINRYTSAEQQEIQSTVS